MSPLIVPNTIFGSFSYVASRSACSMPSQKIQIMRIIMPFIPKFSKEFNQITIKAVNIPKVHTVYEPEAMA